MSSNSKAIDSVTNPEVYDYSIPMESNRIGRSIDNGSLLVLSYIRSYRDRNYIIKDVISKLVQHGELNKSNLMSYCGLNLKKYQHILDDLELNKLIIKNEVLQGKRTITVYKLTEKGLRFYIGVLQLYEKMFPRKKLC
jgi:predicted transcriptional regulator